MIIVMDDHAIIKIAKCADKFDHFIKFNRKTDTTAENVEGNDNALMT